VAQVAQPAVTLPAKLQPHPHPHERSGDAMGRHGRREAHLRATIVDRHDPPRAAGVRDERRHAAHGLVADGRAARLGVIVASVKDHDGPNDRRANLSRPDVYRLAVGLTRTIFAELFGDVPARPPKGGGVALPEHDLTKLDELVPHPVYAWMSWVKILNPTTARFDSRRDLLTSSVDLARDKWRRRLG
jgi:Family of unknown function (DUF6194)